ncbi:hypothetical protein AVEN_42063-1 [Araneus ventricosus]|uniref:EF-hand domain-containing protein n=1 Tax=Araneus ventricosus TaxID=182803 RepID=A0A4Y2RDV9_ARAVE|nr:hypothetical protein AVEN_42063-1 [Araneus ventricosus]
MFKNQPLVEVLRLKSKADIKKAFCGEDSDPNLDSHRFYDFLKLKLGIEINTDDAQKLFYQIDVYNKGFIKYRKLADYLECYEERRLSKDEGIFHPNPSFYQGVRCQGTIFEWTVYEELKDTVDEIAGHYVSLSRSGLLMFWRRDFQKHFETTIAVLDDGGKV